MGEGGVRVNTKGRQAGKLESKIVSVAVLEKNRVQKISLSLDDRGKSGSSTRGSFFPMPRIMNGGTASPPPPPKPL